MGRNVIFGALANPGKAAAPDFALRLAFYEKIEAREGPGMTIEIQKPELEALILQRMQEGSFESVEDALLQALKSSPPPVRHPAPAAGGLQSPTGADLVAAMQSSPYREIALEPAREPMPVREVPF